MNIDRFLGVVKYNRDWLKYIYHRFTPEEGNHPPITFRLRNGQQISVKRDARFTLNEIYLDRTYEIPGVDMAGCRSILDLGGNVGLFALWAVSVSPQATVHCYEPEPQNFAMLNRNLEANGETRVRTYPLAVSAKCGAGHMQLQSTSITHSLKLDGDGGPGTVEVVDMQRVFDLAGVDHFDFVKMDVEGAEREILAGCTDDHLRRMRAISMEWHLGPKQLDIFLARLRGLGFEANPGYAQGKPKYLKARLR